MDLEHARSWLANYGTAWETGDSQKLAALFTETAIYQDNPFNVPMVGRAQIRDYWNAGAGEGQSDVAFSYEIWDASENRVIAHWRCRLFRKSQSRHVCYEGVFRLTFDAEGKAEGLCSKLEEWWMSDA